MDMDKIDLGQIERIDHCHQRHSEKLFCIKTISSDIKTNASTFQPKMGDGDHNNDLTLPRLFILLSGIASAAVVVTIYNCIAVGWCNRRRSQQHEEHDLEMPSSGLDNSQVNLIPTYRYDKKFGLVGEDSSCSVCLSEFQEGEELRTLPECMHSFHISCVDMWLYSHTSPLCRADTTPSPLTVSSLMNSSSNMFLDLPPDIVRRADSP